MRFLAGIFCLILSGTVWAREPFVWSAKKSPGVVEVEVEIAPHHYLETDSVDFGTGVRVVHAPEARLENRGTRILTEGKWRWILADENGDASPVVRYQGCRAGQDGAPGICLLPQETPLFPEKEMRAAQNSLPETVARAAVVKSFSGAMDRAEFLAWLENGETSGAARPGGDFFLWLLLVFAGGAALNLTPCVLPMIPVNLAIIGASGGATGAKRGFFYGAGMAVAYGALGVAVVLGGARFGDAAGIPLFHFFSGGVFFWLALSAAGVLRLDLSRFFTVDARKLTGGAATVAFSLGALAALLAGSCVAPVAAAVLLTAVRFYGEGNVWALALPFALGIGMGAPWPLVGAGLSVLPRPGKITRIVPAVFAVILFAASFYYVHTGVALLRTRVSAPEEFEKVEHALARAKQNRKKVVVEFWSTWCGNCRAFERDVLRDPAVEEALKQVEFVRFQAQDPREKSVRAFLDGSGVAGLPGFVMLSPR